MDTEMMFSGKQRIIRRELFEFLIGQPHSGRNTIDFDKIVKQCCAKISQGFGEYFNLPQNSELYRGTNFRGVSRNGRCNWQILTMVDS